MSKDIRPTPKEFAGVLLTISIPAITILIMVLMLFGCKPVEPIYRSNGDESTMEYVNRRGDLVIVPLSNNECEGYRKPYHTVQYNKR